MPPPKVDRKSITDLHTTANGTGRSSYNPPPNQRDASGSASNVWTKKPTAIDLPSNTPRSTPSQNRNRNLFDPFSRHLGFTANLSASMTLSNRRIKRPKLERGDMPSARGLPARRSLAKGKNNDDPRLVPDDVIMIDDESEDLGEPLPPSSSHLKSLSSPDPLDIIDRPRSCLSTKLVQQNLVHGQHPFDAKRGKLDSLDGLRQTYGELSSDPVENSPPSSPLPSTRGHPIGPGFVRREAHRINATTIPHYDLSTMRGKMKPKSGALKITPSPQASHNDNPFRIAATTKPPASSSESSNLITILNVKTAYIGAAAAIASDISLRLKQEADDLILAIRISESSTLLFRATSDIARITMTDPKIDATSSSLQFMTRKTSETCDRTYPGYEPGHDATGKILLTFQPNQQRQYRQLHVALKKQVEGIEYIDQTATRTMCEGYRRSAHITMQRYEPRITQLQQANPSTKPPSGTKRKLSFDEEKPSAVNPRFGKRLSQTSLAFGSTWPPNSSEESGPSASIPLRRSTRRSAQKEPSPPLLRPEADEIILVYPPNTTGAVTIKSSDLLRLHPGEFLNDTLIEFGLKLWLKELEDVYPELAKDVYVFNSFFYKKLKVRNIEEGYQSVRKWTSKFDIFRKKYLIVPINENLHWHLAIIYEPEHILRPPEPAKDPPRTRRKSGREENALQVIIPDSSTSQKPPDEDLVVLTSDLAISQRSQTPTSELQEAEVEEQLVPSSDGVELIGGGPSGSEDAQRDSSPLSPHPDDDVDIVDYDDETTYEVPGRSRSLSASETTSRPLSVDEDVNMSDGDVTVASAQSNHGNNEDLITALEGRKDATDMAAEPIWTQKGINVTHFYGKTSRPTRRRIIPSTPPENVDPIDADVEVVDNANPRTYIFTLDSLGSRHTAVGRTLNTYLKLEAKDKKGIELTSDAQTMQALVPFQPNHCDCGVYLLHFAQTFMKDPQKYCRHIQTHRSGYKMPSRQADWDDASVGQFRDRLATKILTLSEDWKKDRAPKGSDVRPQETVGIPEGLDSSDRIAEGQIKPETEVIPDSEDSDGSVEFVEMKSAPTRGRGRAKGRGGMTPKPTSKAARLRG